MSSEPLQSICILRLSAIGDVCNAVAAVQAIQRHYPEAKVTWVIGKVEYQLLEGLPGIEFIVYDKRGGKPALTAFKQAIKGRRFDALLIMQVALRANLLSRHIKAKRRIGFDRARSKELHSLFINERVAAHPQAHVLEGFFDFAYALGVPRLDTNPTWNIPVAPEDNAYARAQISGAPRTLIIAPSASKAERNWLPDRYAAIVDQAGSLGFKVFLCGGPGEQEAKLANNIEQFCTRKPINLLGQTSLKQLFAIIKQASLVLAPDTGPAHMAVAAGTPVIGLYGHSNPARTGPYLYQDHVVEVYHQHLQLQTGKSADQNPWGKRVKGEHIMADISTEQVSQTLQGIAETLPS